MAAVNMATFAVLHALVPTLVASAAGIATAAMGNYLAGDRIVFRARAPGNQRGKTQAA
jgi:putative flippase GtrA